MAITLAQLRARAQVISDCYRFTTAEWNDLINDGIRALYSDVVAANPDFRVSGSNFSITSTATPSASLPADFRQERAVVLDFGLTTQVYLPRFTMRDGQVSFDRSYRLEGTTIVVEPRERSIGSYRLLYVPTPPTIASDGTNLDSELEQFQDVIILHAAMLAMTSEETDISQVAVQLGKAMERVRPWASSLRSVDRATVEDKRAYGRTTGRLRFTP